MTVIFGLADLSRQIAWTGKTTLKQAAHDVHGTGPQFDRNDRQSIRYREGGDRLWAAIQHAKERDPTARPDCVARCLLCKLLAIVW